MKILFVIDHLGSGGAQRQMVTLACAIQAAGHVIEFFIYHPEYIFFHKKIVDSQINVHMCKNNAKGFSLKVLFELRKKIVCEKYDVVLSYLSSPNIYSELVFMSLKRKGLIVSERNSSLFEKSIISAILRRALHFRSDFVVANTHAQKKWLDTYLPWLRKKTVTILNGLEYCPKEIPPIIIPDDNKKLKLIAIGRVCEQKNVINLIEALNCFFCSHGWIPSITWVGRHDSPESYCRKVERLLEKYPHVRHKWEWLGERADINNLIIDHHALILPSLYEGLPNVVCEAMCLGKIVLVSNVSDNSIIVKNGERGFLFDPSSPDSIAKAIFQLSCLTATQWMNFSNNGYLYAKETFSVNRLTKEYLQLFESCRSR